MGAGFGKSGLRSKGKGGKRKEERGKRKEERGKRKEEYVAGFDLEFTFPL
jgi:hypothetical protein